jgi:hypothetical protein
MEQKPVNKKHNTEIYVQNLDSEEAKQSFDKREINIINENLTHYKKVEKESPKQKNLSLGKIDMTILNLNALIIQFFYFNEYLKSIINDIKSNIIFTRIE